MFLFKVLIYVVYKVHSEYVFDQVYMWVEVRVCLKLADNVIDTKCNDIGSLFRVK